MQLAPGLHRFTNGVSNFYALESDQQLTLVDAGTRGDWHRLSRELAKLGREPRQLRAILLTHAHSDHTGFAETARSEAGASVWVHSSDAGVARTGKAPPPESGLAPYLRRLEAWRTVFGLLVHGGATIAPVRVVSEFTDGTTLEVPGRPRVLHLPGHTSGMSALHQPELGRLFTGDAVVTRNPLTGRRGPQIMPRGLNQDSALALRSLDRLAGLRADLVLPGHGDPWAGGGEELVRRARQAGMS